MLLVLVFPGVAFHFGQHTRKKTLWNMVFECSSLLACLVQEIAFGDLISGLGINESDNQGNVWAWATPFSAMVAYGGVSGNTLLDSVYVMIKTEVKHS